MDIIPYMRYIGIIFSFGFMFYFLALCVTQLTTDLPISSVFFTALLSLWSALPGVVLLRQGIKLIRDNQKRRF